jgi:hypothetical protein
MTVNATAGIFCAAMKVAYCHVWAQRPFIGHKSTSYRYSRDVPEHINAVIDEVGLDKSRFAAKLSSESRKQSERNEGDDGRQIGVRTTD